MHKGFIVIDAGNSRTKIICRQEDDWQTLRVFTKEDNISGSELSRIIGSQTVLLCSVGSQGDELHSLLQPIHNPFRLIPSTPLPIANDYLSRQTLGMDRVAAVCGGAAIADRERLDADLIVVADFGTALTLDLLLKERNSDSKWHFKGGNISAGVAMRLKSLNNFTHALPLLSPDEATKLSSEKPHYGTDTRSALANGAINGIAAETICFVITASAIYNKRNVLLLLTGGDSRAIEKSLKGIIKDLCPEKQIKIRREDHLIADGMVAIYKYNKIKE